MLQLINFLTRNRGVILFLFLEFIAFVFIVKSHSFHYSKYLDSANAISGGIYNKTTQLSDYLKLTTINDDLVSENKALKNKLEKLVEQESENASLDSVKYFFTTARIINNNYRNKNNILTLDKGSLDGVKPNMGVVLSNGMIGITLNTSKHYTTVLSLLNNNRASFNAKLLKSHHYGSLIWNGDDFSSIDLVDLPIQANVKIGDTIISGGKSVIFPENIPVGIISDFKIKDKSYEFIKVELFVDFSALHHVYIVENNLRDEQIQLENIDE